MDFAQFLSLDVPPLFSALFCAVSCALLGNYLVLRRLSLMGDAISHSVLPGIVAAFLLTSSRSDLPVFLGAAAAGILSAAIIEVVRRYGNVETGAAMGVVFSIFFALGVVLIEQAAARSIDLDADCLLHGQLESIFWYPPAEMSALLSLKTLKLLPSEVITSFAVFCAVLLFVALFYKELKLAAFDPALANALGFSSNLMHQLLMFMVACAVVASFKVVGSILVIAMIICPAAAARMWTDSLRVQLKLSALIAALSCVMGYILGAFGPFWVGYSSSVSAAGMIAVSSGILLAASILFAPKHGYVARTLRQRRLSLRVRSEDFLALLFRFEETRAGDQSGGVAEEILFSGFGADSLNINALNALIDEKKVERRGAVLKLTELGRELAAGIVRTHRLWESYLVERVGLQPDHVHDTAERLEHVTAEKLARRISENQGQPQLDPHGKKIP